MSLSSKDLINLPVYTQSDKYLGKVLSFEIDADTQTVIKYYVRAGSLAAELLGESKELIISQNQVISLTEEKMVVEDLVGMDLAEEKKQASKNKEAVPVMSVRV